MDFVKQKRDKRFHLQYATILNTKMGRPYFPKKPQPKTKNKTDPHFLTASTQPNSTKFRMNKPTKYKTDKKSTMEDEQKQIEWKTKKMEDDKKYSKKGTTKNI